MGWLSNSALMTLIATSAVVVAHDAARSQTVAPQTAAPKTAAPQKSGSAACTGEADCLKRFPELFSRSKNLVRVKLANGKVKTFKENRESEGEGWRTYGVYSYYPQWHAVVFGVGYSEGGDVLVINHLTGTSVTPLSIPQYSNSGTSFAAVGNCDAYCEDGIEIWWAASDPPHRVFKHTPVGGRRYEFAGWNGEDRVKLRVSLHGTDEKGKLWPDKSQPAEVVRGPNGWQLVEPQLKSD